MAIRRKQARVARDSGNYTTGIAAAGITVCRLLKATTGSVGNRQRVQHAGAGERVVGVSMWDNASGADDVLIAGDGNWIEVEAGAAITAGAEVQSDASGRAVPLTTGRACGTANGAASGAGQFVFIALSV